LRRLALDSPGVQTIDCRDCRAKEFARYGVGLSATYNFPVVHTVRPWLTFDVCSLRQPEDDRVGHLDRPEPRPGYRGGRRRSSVG
jgi:hypothetical protein